VGAKVEHKQQLGSGVDDEEGLPTFAARSCLPLSPIFPLAMAIRLTTTHHALTSKLHFSKQSQKEVCCSIFLI